MLVVVLLLAITALWIWGEREARAEDERIRQEEKAGYHQVLPVVEVSTCRTKAKPMWQGEDVGYRRKKVYSYCSEIRHRPRRKTWFDPDFKKKWEEDIDWHDDRRASVTW